MHILTYIQHATLNLNVQVTGMVTSWVVHSAPIRTLCCVLGQNPLNSQYLSTFFGKIHVNAGGNSAMH